MFCGTAARFYYRNRRKRNLWYPVALGGLLGNIINGIYDAVNSCTMLCQWGVDCTANCGDDSLILCPYKGRCEASVGDNSGVACDSAELCDVECRGSCEVTCGFGKCQVRCADPQECLVICSHGTPGVEGTLCPDGKTKVCAMECPGETPAQGADVGVFEVQP